VIVVLTGGSGMLGSALQRALARATHVVYSLTKSQADVTSPHGIANAIDLDAIRPDWIINPAAFTRVDECELDPDHAFKTNALGARHVAMQAQAVGARSLFLSTDYVFSGESKRPYLEDDPTGPLSVYGKSKLAGEQAVREAAPDAHLIVRTAWLYGAGGTNFVDTIVRKARAGEPLRVVDDQRGAATWTADLASALVRLMDLDARGTYHCTSRGDGTWFDVAAAAIELAGAKTRLDRTDTESLARPAPRPRYSVLDCGKFERATGMTMPDWRDALKRYLAGGA
jgi:dTDP-4-dehydrorhamnose reductase